MARAPPHAAAPHLAPAARLLTSILPPKPLNPHPTPPHHQQVLDLFQDDFAALAEDDGADGHRADMALAELSSFTDLVYSKNKVRRLPACLSPCPSVCLLGGAGG